MGIVAVVCPIEARPSLPYPDTTQTPNQLTIPTSQKQDVVQRLQHPRGMWAVAALTLPGGLLERVGFIVWWSWWVCTYIKRIKPFDDPIQPTHYTRTYPNKSQSKQHSGSRLTKPNHNHIHLKQTATWRWRRRATTASCGSSAATPPSRRRRRSVLGLFVYMCDGGWMVPSVVVLRHKHIYTPITTPHTPIDPHKRKGARRLRPSGAGGGGQGAARGGRPKPGGGCAVGLGFGICCFFIFILYGWVCWGVCAGVGGSLSLL